LLITNLPKLEKLEIGEGLLRHDTLESLLEGSKVTRVHLRMSCQKETLTKMISILSKKEDLKELKITITEGIKDFFNSSKEMAGLIKGLKQLEVLDFVI